MKESDFVRLLLKNLNGVFHRNHGSRFGTAGLPDIEGCLGSVLYTGRSCVIEAKIGRFRQDGSVSLKNPLTDLQRDWLLKYDDQGAISLLAVYLENAENRRKNITIFFSWTWIRATKAGHIKAFGDWNLFNEDFIQRRILT